MSEQQITDRKQDINVRNIARWNREIVEKARKSGIEVSGTTNSKEILRYALDEKLREEEKFTNECAMKAVMFLEWLAKKNTHEIKKPLT